MLVFVLMLVSYWMVAMSAEMKLFNLATHVRKLEAAFKSTEKGRTIFATKTNSTIVAIIWTPERSNYEIGIYNSVQISLYVIILYIVHP